MTIKLYHQAGHNTSWNIESLTEDSCGDGIIFSPVHFSASQLEKVSGSIKKKSIFDPQYYLPNSQKQKLNTYDFFPETLMGGFSTTSFASMALKSAEMCVKFQIQQEFEKIIIPARYFSQMDPDYTDKQDTYTVHPFLKVISTLGSDKSIYLTLPLTSHMVEHATYRTRILNWVTGFSDIQGVYLIVDFERNTKQVQSKEFLYSLMEFVKELRDADLEVLVGYLNTEGLLLSLIEGCQFTFGTFENTRIFSIDKFLVSDEERRGPKARMYLTGLLNWVQYSQAKEIMADNPDVWTQIYQSTKHGDAALKATVVPTFNQPGLYKHHFLCFQSQVDELAKNDLIGRFNILKDWIKSAMEYYKKIENMPMDIEKHGNGDHLQHWLDAINLYYRHHLKS